MALNKQAKILTPKQQELALSYLERTRYPLRNKIIFMLSYKAGLRAKEIANLSWLMVCDSQGQLSSEINLINKASKGKQSGRIIPLHKDLAVLLAELLSKQQKDEHFNLTNRIITTERDNKSGYERKLNFANKTLVLTALTPKSTKTCLIRKETVSYTHLDAADE